MIDRDGRDVSLTCDDCSTETFGPYDDFAQLLEAAKDNGWKVFKRHGAWHHSCPSCSQEWLDGMKQERLFN